jgi:hypothetical protein
MNNKQVCDLCKQTEHRSWCKFKPKPTPDPNPIFAKVVELVREQHFKTPDPKVECEYCGPVCYKGAAHNARVEDNAKVEQLPKRPQWVRIESVDTEVYAKADADHFFESLEADLRVYKRAYAMACEAMTDDIHPDYVEAARKEQ